MVIITRSSNAQDQKFVTIEFPKLNGGEGTSTPGGTSTERGTSATDNQGIGANTYRVVVNNQGHNSQHNPYGRLTRLEFSKLNGEDVKGMNVGVKQFFSINQIRDVQKMRVSSAETLSCEPMVSSLKDEIDFRISFDDSDDEDYMNEFPAIVYNDAQASKSDLLTEPILNPQHIDEFDLNDKTLLSEYDEEEQNVLYFNDLFPFNIIHPDDLKSEKDNDDNEIDIIQSSWDMALPPCDQRHQYLRYEGLQYSDADIVDFKARLARIYKREVHRVQVFDFGGLPDLMAEGLSVRILMEHRDAQGAVTDLDTPRALQDFLGIAASYTAIRDLILKLCRRLIACSITGRSQAPEKVLEVVCCWEEEQGPYLWRSVWILMTHGPWVAQGPKRQPDVAAGAHSATKDIPTVDDDMPQAVPPPPRTQGESIARLEEEVHGMRELLQGRSEVLDHMARDFSRFATWTVTSLAQMKDRAGMAYTSYSETQGEYQRRTKCRTNGANTSTDQQNQQQPDP
ncbi:hypothetical protein Tco_0529057 [Tanacetum coccineum]